MFVFNITKLVEILIVIVILIIFALIFLFSYIKEKLIDKKEKIKLEKNRKIATRIIEKFEEILEKNNITIPNKDRTGCQDEARIYGSDYYDLEDTIVEILDNKNT